MLNQRERYAILTFIHYCCKFAPFATKADLVSWSLGESAGPRRFISSTLYANLIFHTVFKLTGLLYVLSHEQFIPLYQVILHLGLVVGYTLCSFWYYTAYIKNFQVHKALVQIILKPVHSKGEGCPATSQAGTF